MFAVRISHPVTDSALGAERDAFDAAVAGWCGWLEQRPGLISIVMLEEGVDAVSVTSFWLDQDAFANALGDPEAMRHAAPLGPFLAAPSAPEAVPVLYFGVGA